MTNTPVIASSKRSIPPASFLGAKPTGRVPLVLIIIGSVALCASSSIHFYLWSIAYRNVDTIGPLFLFQGSVAAALAVLDMAVRRVGLLLFSALFMASTIGGFILATTVGLFGFALHEITAWAVWSVVAEAIGAAVLSAAVGISWRGQRA